MNTKIILKNIAFWTWCLPQTIAGFLFFKLMQISNAVIKVDHYKNAKIVYLDFLNKKLHWHGSSFGKYIFINKYFLNKEKESIFKYVIKHEYGHTIQSFILGPLYIPLIGITSSLVFAISRINPKFVPKYFDFFPENWANKLAGLGTPPYNLALFNTRECAASDPQKISPEI